MWIIWPKMNDLYLLWMISWQDHCHEMMGRYYMARYGTRDLSILIDHRPLYTDVRMLISHNVPVLVYLSYSTIWHEVRNVPCCCTIAVDQNMIITQKVPFIHWFLNNDATDRHPPHHIPSQETTYLFEMSYHQCSFKESPLWHTGIWPSTASHDWRRYAFVIRVRNHACQRYRF